jgi:hypothetical protein
MKHVKYFENIASENLKRYIIFDSDEKYITLYQTVLNGEKLKPMMVLYFDNDNIVDKSKDSTLFFFWCDKNFLSKVLYQTDILDDAIKQMYTIRDSKKYNL